MAKTKGNEGRRDPDLKGSDDFTVAQLASLLNTSERMADRIKKIQSGKLLPDEDGRTND